MSFLRFAAVLIGLAAAPVLFSSAETLSARAREAERLATSGATGRQASERLAAAKAQGMRGAEPEVSPLQGREGRRNSAAAPTFARIVIDPDGASSFEGLSTPGAEVTLNLDARLLGKTLADSTGVWRLTVAQPMAAGDHNITSSSKLVDQARDFAGQEVRIAIPDTMAGKAVVAYEAPAQNPAEVGAGLRARAEELAAAASQKFTEFAPPADGARAGPEGKIAQAPSSAGKPGSVQPAMPPAIQKEPYTAPGADSIAAPVFEWLERSAREFQGTVVKGLSQPEASPRAVVGPAARSAASTVVPGGAPPVDGGASGPGTGVGAGIGDAVTDAQIAVQEWLARANRSYQTEVMRKLEQPAAGSADTAAELHSDAALPAAKSAATENRGVVAADDTEAKAAVAEAARRRADEERRLEDDARRAEAAKRAAGSVDRAAPKPIEQVKPLTAPADTAQQSAAEEVRRKRAADEADRKDAELARQKAVEDLRQKEETSRKLAEDARRRAEEITRQKNAEDARLRAAEAKRREDARLAAAGKAAATTQSADLARKAIEAARSGPGKRAAEKQVGSDPGKTPGAAAHADAAAKEGAEPAEKASEAKAAARPKDTRIAEGSGEKGPVDKSQPKSRSGSETRREPLDRSGRSGLGLEPPAGTVDRSVHARAQQPRRSRDCGRAGREITPPGTYVVAAGDTLSQIAERHYGTARRMQRIVKANRRTLGDPDLIRPCQRIHLP